MSGFRKRSFAIGALLALATTSNAQKFYSYVGDVGPNHALIAWGTAADVNSIGRSSRSHGTAMVKVGDQQATVTDHNYSIIRNLTPNTEYEYEVTLQGRKIGQAKFRTWPDRSEKLRFFVIGDFGSGDTNQQKVAQAMWQEYQKHAESDNPVRFVITTGDNIYGTYGLTLRFRDTGDEDTEWENTFFRPFEPLIARIPFFASPGNHDGNETEARADLQAYLDNFFFPLDKPARYYRFNYGGFVDFFSLDSTTNTEEGPPRPAYLANEDQHNWLKKNLAEARVPWKIPYFHHPPFNAGPRHPAAAEGLSHFLDAFKQNGVKVVFTGHEHNFQFSRRSGETGGIVYVVSGAGGELRTGNVAPAMDRAQIEGWAPQLHFVMVEIEGKEMRIYPKSFEEVRVVDRARRPLTMPVRVTVP